MSRQKNSLKKTKLFNFAESTIPNPDRYLRVGMTISISVRLYSSVRLKPVEEHAAEVIKVSPRMGSGWVCSGPLPSFPFVRVKKSESSFGKSKQFTTLTPKS